MIKTLRSIPVLGALFQSRPPAPKPDYSWMDHDQQAEWEALRAIEMALFDAEGGSKTIFHHSV
jgi:hypothetical protein